MLFLKCFHISNDSQGYKIDATISKTIISGLHDEDRKRDSDNQGTLGTFNKIQVTANTIYRETARICTYVYFHKGG